MRRGISVAAICLGLAACNAAEPPRRSPSSTPSPTPVAAAKPAVTPTAAPANCPAWKPANPEESGITRTTPLPIPAKFRDIASADVTVMTVRRLDGGVACIRLEWIDAASDFSLSADARYLGFSYVGYENSGYRLVDRRSGKSVETGVKPVFAKDGTLFAAAQLSEATMGGLEAIGVWEVRDDDLVPLATIEDGLPQGYASEEWAVQSVGPGRCVALSALPAELAAKAIAEGHAPGKPMSDVAGRVSFRLAPVKGKWQLQKVEGPACPS